MMTDKKFANYFKIYRQATGRPYRPWVQATCCVKPRADWDGKHYVVQSDMYGTICVLDTSRDTMVYIHDFDRADKDTIYMALITAYHAEIEARKEIKSVS